MVPIVSTDLFLKFSFHSNYDQHKFRSPCVCVCVRERKRGRACVCLYVCHHHATLSPPQFHINRGNRVSHFNASLTDEGDGGVARQWPETTTFEEKVCQTAYFEVKRVSSIRKFLTEDAAKTLVTSYIYILSLLDYCNCLLMGTPNSVIQPLQKIQNFVARLVLLAPCHQHSECVAML